MMNKDLQNIKLIESYLEGDLTPEQKTQFEELLKADSSLQNDIKITKRLISGIRGYAFKEMLNKIHEQHIDDIEKKQ